MIAARGAASVPEAAWVCEDDAMDDVTTAFARHYWDEKRDTFFSNTFMGVICLQHPFDVQVTEEIIWETRPEVIVECGSFGGGSALRWAAMQETAGIDGCVVAIDIEDRMDQARAHALWDRRVRFLHGSTTDPAIVERAVEVVAGRRAMVILDSDHAEAHVAAELRAWAPVVSPGCYLIVQDGFVASLDPAHGPGPLEAIEAFLATDDRFEVDAVRERQLFTFNPSGFLRRR